MPSLHEERVGLLSELATLSVRNLTIFLKIALVSEDDNRALVGCGVQRANFPFFRGRIDDYYRLDVLGTENLVPEDLQLLKRRLGGDRVHTEKTVSVPHELVTPEATDREREKKKRKSGQKKNFFGGNRKGGLITGIPPVRQCR